MVGAILALCLIGLAQIYSSTYNQQSGVSSIFYTQIWAILLGFLGLLVALSIDYRSLAEASAAKGASFDRSTQEYRRGYTACKDLLDRDLIIVLESAESHYGVATFFHV